MQINKAALEIFDFTSSLAVYSEHELKVGDQAIQDYIANHVVKAFKDPGARTGTLHDASPVGKQLVDYKNGALKFIDLSKNLGESLFTYMKQATDSVVIDTIICEAVTDTSYVCILLCQAHDAFTHQLFSEDMVHWLQNSFLIRQYYLCRHKNYGPLHLLISMILVFVFLNLKVNLMVRYLIS